MKTATIFERARTRTLALGIVIVLGVGIAKPFVMAIMTETGSVDILQDAFAYRCDCVYFQSQENTGNNVSLVNSECC